MADLSNVSAEAIQQAMEWVKQAKDFAVEQAPLLAREIVIAGIARNTAQFLMSIVIIIVIVFCSYKFVANYKKIDDATDGLAALSALVLLIGGSMALLGLSMFAFDCIAGLCTAIFAPRLYVIEQLAQLVK